MHIIIPLAGRGSRFKEAGYVLPKPLIVIKEKSMIEWATDAINETLNQSQLTFIILEKDVQEFQLEKKLKEKYPHNTRIIVTPKVTEGALISVLLAKEFIQEEEELIIYNGDQYFTGFDLELEKERNKDAGGIIPYFYSNQPRWSFVKLNENKEVIEVSEKVTISTHATIGLYYFKKGRDFLLGAEEIIKKDLRRNNEFYIAPVYNELIHKKIKIVAMEVKHMWGLGSPEDVAHFEKYYREEYI